MRAPTATRGPLPKRVGTALGHKSKAEVAQVSVAVREGRVGPHKPPKAPRDRWHPNAVMWYRAVCASGHSEFYDAADWALAYATAQEYSRYLCQPLGFYRKGDGSVGINLWDPAFLKVFLAANEALLNTEAARRRARIEIQRVPHGLPATGGKPKELTDYRARLAAQDTEAAPAPARKNRAKRAATA